MPKIDSQMFEIYQKCAESSKEEKRMISENEAKMLIRRADALNNTPTSSFSHETRRGNKYLLRLLTEYGTNFSPESKQMIHGYCRNAHIPDDAFATSSTSDSSTSSRGGPTPGFSPDHGGRLIVENPISPSSNAPPTFLRGGTTDHAREAPVGRDVPRRRDVDRPDTHRPRAGDTRNVGAPNNQPAVDNSPTGGIRPSAPAIPASVRPSAPVAATSGNIGVVGPHGTCILDYKSPKETWRCHWFPLQERRPGGDPINNLYAMGGPLDKLDKITGGHARQYEYDHNRKAIDDGREFSWWGHCNNASEASCILREPKKNVVMKGEDGSSIIFTTNDIQGLLVKVTPSLIDRVDFKGTRFNEPSRDNPDDPLPALFIEVMQQWSKEGLPFVLDIDRREQVWNFPYDQAKIYESDSPPEGSNMPATDNMKFYYIEMSGTGFDDKKRIYEGYIKRDNNGNVASSGWIKTPHNNPDFMWRPHPRENIDITNKEAWRLRGRPSNPEVDPQVVYEIYMRSLDA